MLFIVSRLVVRPRVGFGLVMVVLIGVAGFRVDAEQDRAAALESICPLTATLDRIISLGATVTASRGEADRLWGTIVDDGVQLGLGTPADQTRFVTAMSEGRVGPLRARWREVGCPDRYPPVPVVAIAAGPPMPIPTQAAIPAGVTSHVGRVSGSQRLNHRDLLRAEKHDLVNMEAMLPPGDNRQLLAQAGFPVDILPFLDSGTADLLAAGFDSYTYWLAYGLRANPDDVATEFERLGELICPAGHLDFGDFESLDCGPEWTMRFRVYYVDYDEDTSGRYPLMVNIELTSHVSPSGPRALPPMLSRDREIISEIVAVTGGADLSYHLMYFNGKINTGISWEIPAQPVEAVQNTIAHLVGADRTDAGHLSQSWFTLRSNRSQHLEFKRNYNGSIVIKLHDRIPIDTLGNVVGVPAD